MPDKAPNLNIFRDRARQYFSQGRYEESLVILSDLLAAAPDYGPAYADRGTALGVLKQYEPALSDLRHAVKLGIAEPEVYNAMGTVQLHMGALMSALATYSKAVELDATYPLTYFNRSAAFEKMGDTASARADLQTCLSFESDEQFTAAVKQRLARLGQ